jgi:hypothetical protein
MSAALCKSATHAINFKTQQYTMYLYHLILKMKVGVASKVRNLRS